MDIKELRSRLLDPRDQLAIREFKAAADEDSERKAVCLGWLFGDILRWWLTRDERYQITRLNAAEKNPNICHSHDFCDPNQAMLDAMEKVGIDFFPDEGEPEFDLVKAAWPIGIGMLHDEAYGISVEGP